MTDLAATIPKPADRAEWLALRRPHFNASAAGALYGCHPHLTLADVAAEKLGAPDDTPPTEAMERGQLLEPVLLAWMERRLGIQVITPDVLYVGGPIMATLDGEPVGSSSEWIEAKTTADYWDEVPRHVYWQVVAQAAATGRRRCHVVWIDARLRFLCEVVEVPEDDVTDVLDRAGRFMAAIELGMVPEGVELGTEHVKAMYPTAVDGSLVDVDDEGLQAVVAWEQARRARLDAEAQEKAARDAVARLFMDYEGLRYGSSVIATWKAGKPSERPDWKSLEADHPDLVAEYRREVPGARTMRATKALGA